MAAEEGVELVGALFCSVALEGPDQSQSLLKLSAAEGLRPLTDI